MEPLTVGKAVSFARMQTPLVYLPIGLRLSFTGNRFVIVRQLLYEEDIIGHDRRLYSQIKGELHDGRISRNN